MSVSIFASNAFRIASSRSILLQLHRTTRLQSFATDSNAGESSSAPKNRSLLRNTQIPYETINLVDPETNKLLKMPLTEALGRLDEKKHQVLVLVQEKPFPITKIMNLKEMRASQQARKARNKTQKQKQFHKEVQLTWTMAEGDAARKIEKIREDLQKGGLVDVVYVSKRGKRWPTREEIYQNIDAFMVRVGDVGRQRRPPEVVKAMATIFLESSVGSGPSTANPDDVDTS